MPRRFDAKTPCPNCGGGGHLPQGHGTRCWGISYEDSFLCTREKLSSNCKETDSGFGYLHYYSNCNCGKPHDGAQAAVLQRTKPNGKPNRNREFAKQIWNQTIPPEGTSTEAYLRSRGIEAGNYTDELRHHTSLVHMPTGLSCEAMVARVTDYRGMFIGIERHYLDGGKKAFEVQSKMSLGSTAGGSVKLGKLDGTGVLGAAEGVITAMTLIQELNIPVWACLGAKNIPHLKLPPLGIIETVKIYTDGDADGIKARDKAGDKWLKEGYEVISCVAPESTDYNDWINGATE